MSKFNFFDKLMDLVSDEKTRSVNYQCCAIPVEGGWGWWIKIASLQIKITSTVTFPSKQDARANLAHTIDQLGWEVPESLKGA